MAEIYACFVCITRLIGLLGFVVLLQGVPGSYGYRSLEIIYYIKDINLVQKETQCFYLHF